MVAANGGIWQDITNTRIIAKNDQFVSKHVKDYDGSKTGGFLAPEKKQL